MTGDRIRRYSLERTARPRYWSPLMVKRDSASASHVPPKTGGYRPIRHLIHELRAKEAAQMETLTVNVEEGE